MLNFSAQFAISVQIQMGDALNMTDNGTINYVYLSIKLGDVIVVGKSCGQFHQYFMSAFAPIFFFAKKF